MIVKNSVLCLILVVCISGLSFAQLPGRPENSKKYPNGRNDAWQFIGIGGGGAMFFPAFSKFDPNHAFVACDMGGGYVTYDGGQSWRMFNLRGQIHFYVFDPIDPNTVYAGATGLYRSHDKGNTWTMVYPVRTEFAGFVSKGDHGEDEMVTSDSTIRKVQSLAIDPADSKKLYAGITIDKTDALFTSNDGGLNWKLEKTLPDGISKIFVDPSSPKSDRTIFIAGRKTLSVRKRAQWSLQHGPPESPLIAGVSGGYSAKEKRYTIYAITTPQKGVETNSSIYNTTDGGKNWKAIDQGILQFGKKGAPVPEWRAIATSENHPEIVYVSYQQLTAMDNSILSGVAKSNDFGKTWELVWKDTRENGQLKPATNFSRDWLTDRFGFTWGENPLCLGVSPTDPNLVLGTDFGRTIKSSNGGKTWEQVYSKEAGKNNWTSTGLEVTTGYTLVFDPFDQQHVFLANTDIGLLETKDGMKSWISATKGNGIPDNWVNTCYWMYFDPEVKGRAWAVMSGVHDLPRPKMFRRNEVAKYTGGVLMTENSGLSWQPVSKDIGEAGMTYILMDPTSRKDSRILYACAFGKGVYKSLDGGKHWIQKNKGLEGIEPFAWQITRRETDGVLFLVISRRSEDGSIYNDKDGALYRSEDGAESWKKIALPTGENGPTSLIVDQLNPSQLVVGTWGLKTPGKFSPDAGGGIFLSPDDGKTWRQVMHKDHHISDITYDKRNHRYYACGFEGSAYYSTDGAHNWTRINGYNFKWGKRVEFDPNDPEKIFIITFGGGVWYGPATGDPQALEDIIYPKKLP